MSSRPADLPNHAAPVRPVAPGLTLVCCAQLHANQLERHLELFEHVPEVARVIVVRHEPLPTRLSKLENVAFGGGPRVLRAARMARSVERLLTTQPVDWVIGFNPVPWGSVGVLPALRRGVPATLSFIGMDYLQVHRAWGRPFLEVARRVRAVTVTGQRMMDGLQRLGIAHDRMSVLPHSVDIARFAPRDGPKPFDIVSVGQLIHRKRMDTLIDGLALLRQRGIVLRAGILGRGPLREELEARARSHGVDDLVEFLGYRDDVEAVLASARLFVLTSEWEGVPFALMEAMAAGLVPVVTDVGTIADWISPGRNGFIVPVGDAAALADALGKLTATSAAFRTTRDNVLAQRDRLGFAHGARVWRRILGLPVSGEPRP